MHVFDMNQLNDVRNDVCEGSNYWGWEFDQREVIL